MSFRRNEPHLVWRTSGGLFVSSRGRTGKLCALRYSPHGVGRFGPDLSAHYEVIRTRYGRRHRHIEPEEVRPGMTIYIDAFRGGWVQTSEIQNVFHGVRVDEVTPGAEYLIFGRGEAALVAGHDDVARVLPMYESGWNGQRTNLESLELPERDDFTILRIERSFHQEIEWISPDEMAPGWVSIIAERSEELETIDPQIEVDYVAPNPSDGFLVVLLSEVPGEAGQPMQEVRDIVLRAIEQAAVTCVVCGEPGEITRIHDEDGTRMARALCEAHVLEQFAAETVLLPEPVYPVPPELEQAALEVGPGWYQLLAEFCRNVNEVTTYRRVWCRQLGGNLLARVDLPDDADLDVWSRVRELENHAREQAAVTCEHCGDPGERIELPWRHVCCSECDDAELETARQTSEGDDDE